VPQGDPRRGGGMTTTNTRIDNFRKQFAYEAWANARIDQCLGGFIPTHEILGVWSHLIVTKQMWLARVVGEDYSRLALWSIYQVPEAATMLTDVERRWRSFLEDLSDAELDRVVTFHNTKSQPQADTVTDILMHVVMHGAYHRGQLATLIKVAIGLEAPITDYIVFTREGSPAPSDSRELTARISARRKSV
jgi:uncharacterized damage-inducible protein DinB